MLHIKLAHRTATDPEADGLGREWYGYDPDAAPEVNFEHNRGLWVLGPRAARERYVAFTYMGDHTVKFVAEIDGIEPDPKGGKRKVIFGNVLPEDHPVADGLVGAAQVDKSQNPITYHGDAACLCGCGERVPSGRAFVAGHDQRAVHDRIRKGWGDTLAFIRWFDDSQFA